MHIPDARHFRKGKVVYIVVAVVPTYPQGVTYWHQQVDSQEIKTFNAMQYMRACAYVDLAARARTHARARGRQIHTDGPEHTYR